MPLTSLASGGYPFGHKVTMDAWVYYLIDIRQSLLADFRIVRERKADIIRVMVSIGVVIVVAGFQYSSYVGMLTLQIVSIYCGFIFLFLLFFHDPFFTIEYQYKRAIERLMKEVLTSKKEKNIRSLTTLELENYSIFKKSIGNVTDIKEKYTAIEETYYKYASTFWGWFRLRQKRKELLQSLQRKEVKH